jgi:precorrin-6B methylase 1
MEAQVETYISKVFENDIKLLSFKESNFTFKRTQSLIEMLKNGLNTSHLVKIEKNGFDKPLYLMKIMKDLTVILTLEENSFTPEYTVKFLRILRLNQLVEVLESLENEEEYSALNFSNF